MKWPILKKSAGGRIIGLHEGVRIPVKATDPYLYAPLDGRLVAPRQAFTDPVFRALRTPVFATQLPPQLANAVVYHMFAAGNFLGQEDSVAPEWLIAVGEEAEEGEPIARIGGKSLYWDIDFPETEEILSPLALGDVLGATWLDAQEAPASLPSPEGKGSGALLAVGLGLAVVGVIGYLGYRGSK